MNNNNKHRILVVGVGSIGERHARCFINTDRAEVGICEINTELRNTVSAKSTVIHRLCR